MLSLKHNGIPLYHQLKEIFEDRLASGEWASGDLIPNELELCKQFGVSRGPVRQALDRLVQEGKLARRQGKGTRVLPPKIENELGGFYSFTSLIEQKGLQHSARILSFETVPAAGSPARLLALPPSARVYQVRRLRLADSLPLILEKLYVPEALCPGLTPGDLDTHPLYSLMAERFAISLARATQFFEPALADPYEADILGLPRGAPVLLLQNLTYSQGDRPVVLSRAILRGDRVRYLVELSQPLTQTETAT
jgi:GntR family transcriptional regulator